MNMISTFISVIWILFYHPICCLMSPCHECVCKWDDFPENEFKEMWKQYYDHKDKEDLEKRKLNILGKKTKMGRIVYHIVTPLEFEKIKKMGPYYKHVSNEKTSEEIGMRYPEDDTPIKPRNSKRNRKNRK